MTNTSAIESRSAPIALVQPKVRASHPSITSLMPAARRSQAKAGCNPASASQMRYGTVISRAIEIAFGRWRKFTKNALSLRAKPLSIIVFPISPDNTIFCGERGHLPGLFMNHRDDCTPGVLPRVVWRQPSGRAEICLHKELSDRAEYPGVFPREENSLCRQRSSKGASVFVNSPG